MYFCQHDIGLALREEARATHGRKLCRVAQDQHRHAERQQVISHPAVHHAALVDDDQRGAAHIRVRVQLEIRLLQLLDFVADLEPQPNLHRHAGLLFQFGLQLPQPLGSFRPALVDQPVDRRRVRAALVPHDRRGLAREAAEDHAAVEALGEVLRQCCLSGAGVAGEVEERRAAGTQPLRDRRQRGGLLGGPGQCGVHINSMVRLRDLLDPGVDCAEYSGRNGNQSAPSFSHTIV